MSNPRQRLREIAAERGVTMSHLSALLGRNATYIQQYVTRRSPKRLTDDDRRRLAIALEVDERELGARDPWTPPVAAAAGGHV